MYNIINITIHCSTLTNPLAQTNCLSCVAMKKKPAAAHAAPRGGEARGSPSNLGEQLGDLPAAMSLEEKLEQYQKTGGNDIDQFVENLSQPQQQAII